MTSAKAVAFLQKKSWHTGTMGNREKVWKAEEVTKDKEKKLAELRKELREERELEELRREQDAIKGIERHTRVDFLYQEPLGFQDNNGGIGNNYRDDSSNPVAQLSEKPGSLFISDELDPIVDLRSKVRDDPLFFIKKQQQNLQKNLLDNPIKMKQLREQILREKLQEELKGEKKKRKREEDEERQKKKSRAAQDTIWAEKPRKGEERVKDESRSERSGSAERSREFKKEREGRDERSREPKREKEERRDREVKSERDDDRRSSEKEMKKERESRKDASSYERREESRSKIKEERDDDRRSERRDDRRDERRDDKRDDRRDERRDDRRDDRGGRDSDRNRDSKYEKKESSHSTSNSSQKASSSSSSSKKKQTPEDRQRLLEQMEATALSVREDRTQRIVEKQAEREEEKRMLANLGTRDESASLGGPKFLKDMSKGVYEDSHTASLADRVGRAAHYIQRGETTISSNHNSYRKHG